MAWERKGRRLRGAFGASIGSTALGLGLGFGALYTATQLRCSGETACDDRPPLELFIGIPAGVFVAGGVVGMILSRRAQKKHRARRPGG